jgi:hypothetical protein
MTIQNLASSPLRSHAAATDRAPSRLRWFALHRGGPTPAGRATARRTTANECRRWPPGPSRNAVAFRIKDQHPRLLTRLLPRSPVRPWERPVARLAAHGAEPDGHVAFLSLR